MPGSSVSTTYVDDYYSRIFKPGKDATHPASYRLVGLESCLLKMFTLLWDDRFREWMEDEHILPNTQNGFRRGYHGLNNHFILRCAIETALGSGRPLYVVLPDLTNAFQLTDHSSLWVMMYKHGFRGLSSIGCDLCTVE